MVEPLSSRRPLIILDDPLLGLDLRGRELIEGILREKSEGGSKVIVVSHIMLPGLEPDRLVVMSSGNLIYEGSYDDEVVRRTIISC